MNFIKISVLITATSISKDQVARIGISNDNNKDVRIDKKKNNCNNNNNDSHNDNNKNNNKNTHN